MTLSLQHVEIFPASELDFIVVFRAVEHLVMISQLKVNLVCGLINIFITWQIQELGR